MTPTGRLTALHKAFFNLVLPWSRALLRMPASMPLNPPWWLSRDGCGWTTGRWPNPLRRDFDGIPKLTKTLIDETGKCKWWTETDLIWFACDYSAWEELTTVSEKRIRFWECLCLAVWVESGRDRRWTFGVAREVFYCLQGWRSWTRPPTSHVSTNSSGWNVNGRFCRSWMDWHGQTTPTPTDDDPVVRTAEELEAAACWRQ